MADFLIKTIPIPLPRPIMEEMVHGVQNARLGHYDIPLPNPVPFNFDYPKVGTEWLLIPYTEGKKVMTEAYDLFINNWSDIGIFLFSLIMVGLVLTTLIKGVTALRDTLKGKK